MNNKTAKEMFEKLGYKEKRDDDYINWISIVDDFAFEIAFDYNTQLIEIYSYRNKNFNDKTDKILTLKELQAINKQVEELHWKVEE